MSKNLKQTTTDELIKELMSRGVQFPVDEKNPSFYVFKSIEASFLIAKNNHFDDFQEIFPNSVRVESDRKNADGESFSEVYHFPSHNLYVRAYGYYSSYEGSEYSRIEQVFPKQVTVTQYSTTPE